MNMLLRNIWVWCHLCWLAERRGRGIYLNLELLRLREMTLWLQYLVETEFGLRDSKPIVISKSAKGLVTAAAR